MGRLAGWVGGREKGVSSGQSLPSVLAQKSAPQKLNILPEARNRDLNIERQRRSIFEGNLTGRAAMEHDEDDVNQRLPGPLLPRAVQRSRGQGGLYQEQQKLRGKKRRLNQNSLIC